jgi:starvation-inducible DNA-binding protein
MLQLSGALHFGPNPPSVLFNKLTRGNQTMKPNIGISDSNRKAVTGALAALLANEIALTQATRGAHWNVIGVNFGPLHSLFGGQYDALNDQVDEIAERIRTLGGLPATRIAEFAKAMTIDDGAGEAKSAAKMIESLLAAHEAIIVQLRKEIITTAATADDAATEDFLIGILEAHEKTAWMLRAHLE